MNNRKIKLIICLTLVASFVALISLSNLYAAGGEDATEDKAIVFEDETMYNAMINILGTKVSSHVDPSKTIYITQANIDSIKSLEIKEKNITDIGGIENFTKLTDLDLSENNITNIEKLSNLKDLTKLVLTTNKIENINSLSGLTNLIYVHLGSNNVSDVEPLGSLTKLKELNLFGNKITSIAPLGSLNNLTKLTAYNNKINDISALSNLTNLTLLNLYNNNIEDISPINTLTNLSALNLRKNKISNANILDNELKNVDDPIMSEQEININSEIDSVKLPEIFLQAKDENSKLYTADDYILTGCILSEDGKNVKINDGVEVAQIKIVAGRAENTIVKINLLKLEVTKTTEEPTNQNVVVTISSTRKLNQLEGWKLSEDKLRLTKEYNQNSIENNIRVTSEDGLASIIDIAITNIDKDKPTIEYRTRENEDGSLDMILKANEKIRPVDGWRLSEDQMTLTKTYTTTTTEEITIYDIAGNQTSGKVEIKFKGDNFEEDDAKIVDEPKPDILTEENKDNPKTGDIVIYLGIAIGVACLIFVISTIYIKRKKANK